MSPHSTDLKAHKDLPATKVTNSTSFKTVTQEKKTKPTATTYDVHGAKGGVQVKPKGFQQWRQNRAKDDNNSDDMKKSESVEVNILKVVHPENEIHEKQVHTLSESICTSVSQQTISPDMFDSLADQIVNRVKKELNLNTVPSLPVEHKVQRKLYSPISYNTGKETAMFTSLDYNMDSHHCPNCRQLMVSIRKKEGVEHKRK